MSQPAVSSSASSSSSVKSSLFSSSVCTLSDVFKKAEEGYGYAKRCLAYWYLKRKDLREEIKEYVSSHQKLAENGHYLSLLYVGWCYQYGIALKKDGKKAFDCYITARDLDPYASEAYRLIGLCYSDGIGVSLDFKKALDNYQKALEFGESGIAMVSYGYCFDEGEGVERNQVEAVRWYTFAANKYGNSAAMYNLAIHFRDAEVMNVNVEKSFQLLLLAARDGNSDALYSLGRAFEIGEGCVRDQNQAIHAIDNPRLWDFN